MRGIDLETGLKSTMGNASLLHRLLAKFADSYASFSEDFSQAQQQGSEETTRLAHSLKSNAGSLGALELQARAQELEAACKNKQSDIPQRLDAVISELGTVLTSLQSLQQD